jgi:hypothetical protein
MFINSFVSDIPLNPGVCKFTASPGYNLLSTPAEEMLLLKSLEL